MKETISRNQSTTSDPQFFGRIYKKRLALGHSETKKNFKRKCTPNECALIEIQNVAKTYIKLKICFINSFVRLNRPGHSAFTLSSKNSIACAQGAPVIFKPLMNPFIIAVATFLPATGSWSTTHVANVATGTVVASNAHKIRSVML